MKNSHKRAFGRLLKNEFEIRGLTSYQFSMASGISQQQLSRLIKGQTRFPSLPVFCDLAKALGYKPWVFLRKILLNL